MNGEPPIDDSPPGFADPVVIERKEMLAYEVMKLESVSLQQEWCRLVDAIYGAGPIPVGVNLTVGMAVERADQLHAEITKLRECIGLFSTTGPGDMEMDVENPISMAYQTVAEVARLKERNAKLEAGLYAVEQLIEHSRAVAGLHLNGDEAPWGELRTGGRFEGWLLDFDAACQPAPKEEP